jgi:hypothetical protein
MATAHPRKMRLLNHRQKAAVEWAAKTFTIDTTSIRISNVELIRKVVSIVKVFAAHSTAAFCL